MAPEQLVGTGATRQSDLYALGLVLYELFTGKPPFAWKNLEELQRQRAETPKTTPSTLIPDISPRLESAILRCLEPEPNLRPASALEVAVSLPGGDPLAEALAAGETPSPDLLAASGPEKRSDHGLPSRCLRASQRCSRRQSFLRRGHRQSRDCRSGIHRRFSRKKHVRSFERSDTQEIPWTRRPASATKAVGSSL